MAVKTNQSQRDENEMFRVECNEDWEPGKFFQFHFEPVKGWRPPLNPRFRVLGDVPYKELGKFLDAKRKELWGDVYMYSTAAQIQSGSWLKLRFAVFKRDNYRCQICGRSAGDGVTLEAGHLTARAKGGKDTMENLKTMCFECNRGMGTEEL